MGVDAATKFMHVLNQLRIISLQKVFSSCSVDAIKPRIRHDSNSMTSS